jgi:hypothetical protein
MKIKDKLSSVIKDIGSIYYWRFTVYSFCLFLLYSCGVFEQNYLEDNKVSKIEIEYGFEKVNLIGDSLTLTYYAKRDIYTKENTDWLFGHNHAINSIDVFNLTEKKFSHRINLESDGPNGIERVYQLKVVSLDSIAILDTSISLKIVSSDAKVIKKLDLRVSDSESGQPLGYFYNYNDARIVYEKDKRSFILHFLNESVKERKFKSKDPHSIFGRINLEGEVDFLPISHSRVIYERNGEVIERMPNYSYHKGKIIYGFIFESNIYTFDLRTGDRSLYGGKSKFSQNMQDFSLPPQEFRLLGTWFNSVIFDSSSGFYLRTHWGSQPRLQIDSNPSSALTKPGYIMVFDEGFAVVDEIELPEEYWLEDSFVYSEGMAFWSKESLINEENSIELGLLRIRRKN